MRESILTIPVGEAFEGGVGCPFCKMRNTVEQHICEYIMGAAMMEPDVRTQTNSLGFCNGHFIDLLKQNNRLSLGLMLNSHLEEIRTGIFSKKGIIGKLKKDKRTEKAAKNTESCFVCEKVDWGMNHMAKSFFMMFKGDDVFKKTLANSEFICMPHYAWIREKASICLSKGDLSEFISVLDKIVCDYIERLNGDVSQFCDSFDYRNAGKLHSEGMEHVRSSINRSIEFLTGRGID